ncbi:MAG: nucleotidyltransferase family protein [Sedimentisphaerales bacterium]|nr:nucleotidyltransferase family protein [Sedimentisphaerales bacterium]
MICAIVLAAGCSKRMGTQKLLLPFGKSTVISHIVNQLTKSKVEKTYVVVGHQREQVIKELSDKPIGIIQNPEYKSGMLSSIRAGIRNIPQEYDAVIIALGDQPSITTELIDKVVQNFSSTDKNIIVPKYNDKRGHPILLSTIFKNEILTNFDDIGLRGILQAHDNDIYEMNVTDQSVIADMDYPQDYQQEIERYENRNEEIS